VSSVFKYLIKIATLSVLSVCSFSAFAGNYEGSFMSSEAMHAGAIFEDDSLENLLTDETRQELSFHYWY